MVSPIGIIKNTVSSTRAYLGKGLMKSKWKNKDFTIISNDCWGAEVYKCLDLPYHTPFVGLMILSPCYIKLLENLKYYLSQELMFKDRSSYEYIESFKKQSGNDFPIGVLGGDIELHFLHYSSKEEAYTKWNRRIKRINWNSIFLKYDANKDLATSDHLERFDRLPYPKVSFARTENTSIKSLVKVDEWNLDAVKFFYLSLKEFDVIQWLNGKSGKSGFINKLFYFVFYKRQN